MCNLAVPEQAAEHSKRMLSDGLIHEWLLPDQGLGSAARREAISLVERLAYDLRKQFVYARQARCAVFTAAAQRLAENELPGIGVVAGIQPVMKSARFQPDNAREGRASCSGIDTTDQEIAIRHIHAMADVGWIGNPAQTPKHVQALDQNLHFVKADFALRKRLPDAIGFRDSVSIDCAHVKSIRVPGGEQGMVQKRQPGEDRRSCAAAPDNGNADLPSKHDNFYAVSRSVAHNVLPGTR